MLKAAHMTARTEEKARQKLQRLQEERQKRLDRIAKKTKFDPKSLFQIPNALTTKGLPEIVSRRFNIKAEKTQEELSSSLAEQQKLRILRMS
jgi:CTP synthase (UTP-ammonia lyase)